MTHSEWWRDAVIYQIYVRSFSDGDGSGVGDLPGITARLEQLADLGVDAIWLTPFYPSPMADGGYDVADYTDVEPLIKMRVPVIWINRRGQKLDSSQKKPTAEVKNLRDAAKKLGC